MRPQEHRLALDFDRLEDLGANAIRTSRHALGWTRVLDAETAHQLRRELGDLRQVVERRSAMSRDARHSLRGLMAALLARGGWQDDSPLGPLVEALGESITASERRWAPGRASALCARSRALMSIAIWALST